MFRSDEEISNQGSSKSRENCSDCTKRSAEDQKLKADYGKRAGAKGRRRPGMGLPLVLLVVIVGSALVAVIFDGVSRYNFMSWQQQKTYVQHMSVMDYVEMAKGTISEYNAANSTVLRRESSGTINRASDLQIATLPVLSLDEAAPRRDETVTVQVFDMVYEHDEISPAISLNELAEIPPPFTLKHAGKPEEGMTGEGVTDMPGGGDDGTSQPGLVFNKDQIGAYLIRVKLFETQNGQRTRCKRVAELAFFQITDPN